jgi:hypothetical protein
MINNYTGDLKMANRTIQFLGQGYAPTGTDPIVITATLDGNVVYTGNIPTLYTADVGRLPEDQVVLFTCELPVDFAGTLPVSISLDSPVGVDAYFEQIYSNYMAVPNPVFTSSEIGVLTDPSSTTAEKVAIYTANAVPPLSPAEIAVLENGTPAEQNAILVAHNITLAVSSGADTFVSVNGGNGDPRSNVVINGVAVTRGTSPTGTWGWLVEFSAEESGLIEYDLIVVAGQ